MHRQWLLRTLALAQAHKGFCTPNPAVGAVVVKEGIELSCGSHVKAGEPHAEDLALKQLDYPLTGATLYISLEPCSHWGKTPPCIDAICESGVSNVIFAHSDPNPIVKSFDTIGYLKGKGVTCEQICLPEISTFYRSYDHWVRNKRPYVTVKMAQTLNGKIALPNRKNIQLTQPNIAEFTHQQRQYADGILTTAATIKADDPQLNVRHPNQAVIDKPLAIIDSNLTLDPAQRLFKSKAPRHIFYDTKHKATEHLSQCHYYPTNSNTHGLDLVSILDELGKLGWHDVWVEAGGQLFTSLLQQALIQQLYLYISPQWLPSNAMDAYIGSDMFSLKESAQINCKQIGDDLLFQMIFIDKRS